MAETEDWIYAASDVTSIAFGAAYVIDQSLPHDWLGYSGDPTLIYGVVAIIGVVSLMGTVARAFDG